MNICKQCNNEYEGKRSTSKYCSDKCRKLAFLDEPVSVPEVSVPQKDSVPEVSVPDIENISVPSTPEVSVPEVNNVPLSKGGKWEVKFPYEKNPGMCKYCGKMTYLVDNVTVDKLVECCHKCAVLKR